MKFRTVVQEEGANPIVEDHDLDIHPDTLEAAKLWAQGTVDEYNRYLQPGKKRLSLISVEPIGRLKKTGS